MGKIKEVSSSITESTKQVSKNILWYVR